MADHGGGRRAGMKPVLLALAIALACFAASGVRVPARAQEPDPAFLDRVLASLSVEERVGQLVMVNFVGDDVSADSDVAGLVRDFKAGAVLVTASNGNVVNRGATATQLATLTNGLQQRAFEGTRRSDGTSEYFLPLIIATDNEGDLFPFTNVTHDYTQLPNNMTIGATWDKTQAEASGRVAGHELSASGINMLLGPVVDVLDNPRSGGNGDIGIRSFGGSPAWVGEMGRAYVRGVHDGSDGRMLTVVKHFPGHGGSDRATDSEVPTVNKTLDQLRASELAPFAELNRADANDPSGMTDALMVSHIRYRNFVPGSAAAFTGPISIDSAAFSTLMALPEFSAWRADHLVMADALGVTAMKKWYAQQQGEPEFPNRSVVRDALLAGNDLLPLVEFYIDPAQRGWKDYQLPVIQDSILFMRQEYASNGEFRRRVDDAVRHVIAAKLQLYPQLQEADVLVDPVAAQAAAGTGKDEMHALANAALTLIQPRSVGELRARLPRGPIAPEKVLIVECWEDCYPYRVMPKLDLQNALLSMYGPAGKNRVRAEDVSTISFGELDAWLASPDDPNNAATAASVRDAAWMIFGLTEFNPIGRPASSAVKRFLDSTPVDVRNKNLVAIAYNAPYHLDSTEISKLSAYFAVYNKTEPAIAAGFEALFGDVTPAGHSPVNIAGIFYSIADVTQPADQEIQLRIFGREGGDVPDTRTIGLVAGPIVDRNGSPVPDGTIVSFSLTKESQEPTTASAATVDGLAGAQLGTDGTGSYTAAANVGAVKSAPLAIRVTGDSVQPVEPSPQDSANASGDRSGGLLLALAIGVPSAVGVALAAAAGIFVYRRRRPAVAGTAPAADASVCVVDAPVSAPVAEENTGVLRVDGETRRVYVKGVEAKPPLSNEQFRLLSYLYERAGKVISRDELVQHVWPDAHAEGVSEEALDALVRRVRERIVQAGGERAYLVTLRGQGFRLEI